MDTKIGVRSITDSKLMLATAILMFAAGAAFIISPLNRVTPLCARPKVSTGSCLSLYMQCLSLEKETPRNIQKLQSAREKLSAECQRQPSTNASPATQNTIPGIPIGLPDLIIESISFNESTRIPTVNIKNIGVVTIPANEPVKVMVEYYSRPDYLVGRSISTFNGTLDPNQSASLQVSPPHPDATTATFTVNPNGEGMRQETDRTNNTRQELVPAQRVLNLRIQSVNFGTTTRQPTIIIENASEIPLNAPGGSSPYVTVRWAWLKADGTPSGQAGTPVIESSIAPHQTYSLIINQAPPADAIELSVNVNNRQSVNEATLTDNIWRGQVPQEPKIDLSLDPVTFNPVGLEPRVTIRNRGTGAVGVNDDIIIRWDWLTGSQVRISGGTRTITGGLPAGNVREEILPRPPSEAIQLSISIASRARGTISESNLVNNTWQGAIEKADLAIEQFTFNLATRVPQVNLTNYGLSISVGLPISIEIIWLNENGSTDGSQTITYSDGIEKGASVPIVLPVPPVTTGQAVLTLNQGGLSGLSESNTANNVLRVRVPLQ